MGFGPPRHAASAVGVRARAGAASPRALPAAAGARGLQRELVLAGERIDVVRLHRRQLGVERRMLLLRVQLDMHELAGHGLAQVGQHGSNR